MTYIVIYCLAPKPNGRKQLSVLFQLGPIYEIEPGFKIFNLNPSKSARKSQSKFEKSKWPSSLHWENDIDVFLVKLDFSLSLSLSLSFSLFLCLSLSVMELYGTGISGLSGPVSKARLSVSNIGELGVCQNICLSMRWIHLSLAIC